VSGCRPLPRPECPIERVGILVAEQVCYLLDSYLRPVEVLARQFPPRLHEQLPETTTLLDDPPLQGSIAQPKFARHGRDLKDVLRKAGA
jgi:hypothetical protein